MSDILTVIVIIDGLAVTIGTWVATSHGLFALARDRRLPAPLAGTHPKYGTPRAACDVPGRLYHRDHPGDAPDRRDPLPGDGGNRACCSPSTTRSGRGSRSIGPFLFVFVYLMISVSGVKDLWNSEQRPKLLLAGVVGTLLTLAAMFGTVYKAPSPFNTVPYWAAAWILAGIVIAVLHSGKSQLDSTPGTIERARGRARVESPIAIGPGAFVETSTERSAVVLGARANLGGAIAEQLHAHGWRVLAVARSEESLEGLSSLGIENRCHRRIRAADVGPRPRAGARLAGRPRPGGQCG